MALLTPTNSSRELTPSGAARQVAHENSSGFFGSTFEGMDIKQLWRAVWRWRALVLWTTLGLTVLATFIIFHLTPQYTASADVLVGVQQVKIGKLEDLISDLKNGNGGGIDETVATDIGIIRSRALAEKTVEKLQLQNNPGSIRRCSRLRCSPGCCRRSISFRRAGSTHSARRRSKRRM